MRFGLSFPPARGPAGHGAGHPYDELLRLACRADELGFEHIEVSGLPSSAENRPGPDVVPFLSAVSALTVGIRLVASVAVPAKGRAFELAARLAALDHLSHGRLDVRFDDLELSGDRRAFPRSRRRQPAEVVALFRRSWGGQDADSYQRPHPPIFVNAQAVPAAWADAGRAGFHLHVIPAATALARLPEALAAYRAGRSEAGLDPGCVRLAYACCLAEDDPGALAAARRATVPGTAGTLAGSPARVRDQIAGVADLCGDDLSLQLNLAALPGVDPASTLDLLAEQVMPYLATSSPEWCRAD